ncbi:MAG: LacI family DNA-binding transcriptional regulator [bacterium]
MSGKVTMKDVARRLNVSVSSVSVALNRKPGVTGALRDEVLRTCHQLGYNTRRIVTKSQRGGNVGFIMSKNMPLKSEVYFTQMLMGAETFAEERQFHLLMNTVSVGNDDPFQLPRCFSKQIKGLLIAGYFPAKYVEFLQGQGVPMVLLEYDIPSMPLNAVMCDNYYGAFSAVRHLIDRGHRSIALISGMKDRISEFLRVQGFVSAMREAQLPIESELTVEDLKSPEIGAGYKATLGILRRHPPRLDAFFCITDNYATGCMRAIQESGLKVPDNISVIGFDDMEWVSHLTPPLTSLHVPREVIGEAGMMRLIELVEAGVEQEPPMPMRVVLPVRLIERGSVASR